MRKNCVCGRSLTKCVSQSTPVVTTSLLPPLKVPCTNESYGYAKFAYRSMRRRSGNHGQSISSQVKSSLIINFAAKMASLGDAPFYRGSMNAGNGDTALIFASDGHRQLELCSCRLVYVDATFLVVPSLYYQLFTVFVQHTDHSFPVTHSTMTRKTTALYQRVFEKLHALILR